MASVVVTFEAEYLERSKIGDDYRRSIFHSGLTIPSAGNECIQNSHQVAVLVFTRSDPKCIDSDLFHRPHS